MTFRVSHHAIERYLERVAQVSFGEAEAALSTRVIQIAAHFGAGFVRLASGHRVAIADGVVVTVLPVDHFRRQIMRQGMGRFGNSTIRAAS